MTVAPMRLRQGFSRFNDTRHLGSSTTDAAPTARDNNADAERSGTHQIQTCAPATAFCGVGHICLRLVD